MAEAHPPVPPFAALAVAACAISTGAIFARLADAPALVIAAYRVGIAAAILWATAGVKHRRELSGLSGRDAALAALSGLFLAMHFAAWISSLSYTSIANSVVLVNTNPIWVGLLTPVITRERLTGRVVAGIVVSVAGGVIIGGGDFMVEKEALLGDVLALAGSVCAAFYLLLGRHLRARVSLGAYILLCYGSAAVVLWCWVLAAGLPITGFSAKTWAALWGMAVVAQIIGHSCYNWALKWLSAGVIAVALLGEPVGAGILAYVIFGETLTLLNLSGGALILWAIYLAATDEHRQVPGN